MQQLVPTVPMQQREEPQEHAPGQASGQASGQKPEDAAAAQQQLQPPGRRAEPEQPAPGQASGEASSQASGQKPEDAAAAQAWWPAQAAAAAEQPAEQPEEPTPGQASGQQWPKRCHWCHQWTYWGALRRLQHLRAPEASASAVACPASQRNRSQPGCGPPGPARTEREPPVVAAAATPP